MPTNKDDTVDYEKQQAAFESVVEALRKINRESQIRVIACVSILFDLDHEITSRLRGVR